MHRLNAIRVDLASAILPAINPSAHSVYAQESGTVSTWRLSARLELVAEAIEQTEIDPHQ